MKLRRKTVDLDTGKMLLRVMKTGRKLYANSKVPLFDKLESPLSGGLSGGLLTRTPKWTYKSP